MKQIPAPIRASARASIRGPAALVRRPLREQIYDQLLLRLDSGELAPGTRLRDTAVAADLGVSRTPVRETLLRLTLEGVIAADAGYGFEVKPLDRVDIEQSYPILWTLEGLALRLSPVPTAEHLKTLAVLNARMRKTTDPAELIAVDHKWHALLTSGCPNGRLLDMIASQKKGLRRYEFAYMRAAGDTDESTRYHVAIITALRSRSVRQAIRALEESWRMGMMRLLVWLETTSADRAGSE